VFAEVDGKYGVYTLRELFELHKQGRAIKVPALLDERGNKGWVEVEDVVSFGEQSLKRITLSASRLFVEISEDAIIPAFGHQLFEAEIEKIKLNFKLVNELKVTNDPSYNGTLLLAMRITLNLPEGDQTDWLYGFALGFFISEGNFICRKHKNTKQSLARLKALAGKKGMSLQEYLSYMTNIREVALAVGRPDFERGYVDVVQKYFKFGKPHKDKRDSGYQLYSSDLNYIHLIKDYTEGHDSRTKRLRNEAYNRSWKFLEGILDGFLAGDGYFRKEQDLFQVHITANYKLRDDLIFLSKALGYDTHINKGHFLKSHSINKLYYALLLSIFKNWHRHTAAGLVKEHIKSIEDVGEKEAFNIVLKPLYEENDKRAKFNHLYFTAYGFLVSDAVKTF